MVLKNNNKILWKKKDKIYSSFIFAVVEYLIMLWCIYIYIWLQWINCSTGAYLINIPFTWHEGWTAANKRCKYEEIETHACWVPSSFGNQENHGAAATAVGGAKDEEQGCAVLALESPRQQTLAWALPSPGGASERWRERQLLFGGGASSTRAQANTDTGAASAWGASER